MAARGYQRARRAAGVKGRQLSSGWASRSRMTGSTAGLIMRPVWVPRTATFSARGFPLVGAVSSRLIHQSATPSVGL